MSIGYLQDLLDQPRHEIMSDKVLVTTGRIYSKAIAHKAIVTTQGCPNFPRNLSSRPLSPKLMFTERIFMRAQILGNVLNTLGEEKIHCCAIVSVDIFSQLFIWKPSIVRTIRKRCHTFTTKFQTEEDHIIKRNRFTLNNPKST